MANFIYTPAMNSIVANTLSLNVASTTAGYKVMLLNALQTTTTNQSTQFVSATLGPSEIGSGGAVDNYARGFGGAGRKAVTLSLTAVTTNPVGVIFSGGDITWSVLGGTTNDTIRGCALIKEVTTDADSPCIAYWDISPAVATNGSDFKITVTPGTGNIRFSV